VETLHCELSEDGTPFIRKKDMKDADPGSTVLVAENWNEDRLSFKLPQNGGTYLGSGYFKIAISVRICVLHLYSKAH
jgi:hypothetical protein